MFSLQQLVRGLARGLYRLLWQAYSRSTTFIYGISNLESATGIQQRDPFCPDLFSLGIDSIASRVDTEFNVWYLDDGTIGDSPEEVLSCVRVLVDDLRRVGLEVNHSKCELLILNHTREDSLRTEGMFREIMPGLKVVQRSEATLLGAPRSGEGVSTVLSGKSEDLERKVSKLRLIENR